MVNKKDYLSGVYRSGVFNAYDLNGDYKVTKFDAGSNRDARNLANGQKEVHGTFKDGIFHPANIREESGHANSVEINGQTLRVSHSGDLYDSKGVLMGSLSRDGKFKPYRANGANLESKTAKSDGGRSSKSRRIITSVGERDFYETEQVNSMADWMVRSNAVLGKLGADKTGYRIPKDFEVYETEIPEFRRDKKGLPLFGAYTTHTTDGQRIVVVDSRLKSYEKLALLSHEFAHVAQKHDPKNKAERMQNEREAQTRAIKHMATLYDDYGALQKAVSASGDNAFFNVGRITKKDIAKAIGVLTDSRKYFGVVDDDLMEHSGTFRNVAKDLEGMVAILFLALGSFFFSTKLTGNITGNVIGLSTQTSSWIGFVLLFVGLVAGFFLIKKRK